MRRQLCTDRLLVSPGGGADAYRRSAWTEAGGFDERLSFYGADLDLGLRIRSLGWTTVAAPDAVAVHLRSATSGHRSRRARESGGWARGFLLRRWSVLRSRAAVRALATETLVALADTALSRDTVAIRSRISGWRSAGSLPRRAFLTAPSTRRSVSLRAFGFGGLSGEPGCFPPGRVTRRVRIPCEDLETAGIETDDGAALRPWFERVTPRCSGVRLPDTRHAMRSPRVLCVPVMSSSGRCVAGSATARWFSTLIAM